MILSTIRANSARSGYGSAASGAYYWDMPTTMVVGLATGETALNQTRLSFPSLPQALGGGKAISVSSLKLGLTQVPDATDGTSRTADITAQFTTMSDWNVAYDIAAAVGVNGETEITIPASAAWLLETYTGNVFVHLKATDGPRASFAGWNTGDSAPYLKVLWDYAENTIHTDATYAYTGAPTRFSVTPTADDDRYVLTWQMGGATGTAADVEQRSYPNDTMINWVPSAADFGPAMPDTREAPVALTLTVYDGSGNVIRTENTSLQMIIADTYDRPSIADWGLAYDVQVAGAYNLVGVTEATIAPVVQLTNPAGSTVAKLKIHAYPNQNVLLEWSAGELTDNGDHTYTATRKSLGILQAQADNLTAQVTNARGISRTIDHDTGLEAYDYARPSISLFSAERYGEIIDDDQHVIGYQTDPTGNKVWFSASAAIASVGGANVMNWALTLTSRADGTVLTASGTATGTSLVWSDDRGLIGDTIDPEIVWDAALTVTDSAGFTATTYDVVPAGKAVLHLPACKNGIAFGGLSTATADHPLGEMFYPFYAYAGIHGVTGWSLKEEDTGDTWLDGQKVYRKTLYARIATAGQAVDIPFPDGLQRIVHMQGILYTDDTINRTRPLSWYYNASLNASLWHSGGAYVTVQANGEIGDAFVTIWYTKTAGIVITQQPEDVSVALGGTATFTVAALGTPSYQWQQSTPPTATVGPDELLHVTDALAAPVTALEAAVTPVQSGGGDPSPSNVRPISGWTGANVYVSRTQASDTPVATIAFPEPTAPRNMIINTNVPDVSAPGYLPKLYGAPDNSFAEPSSCTLSTATHGVRLTATANKTHIRYMLGDSTNYTLRGLKTDQPYTISFDYAVKMYSSGTSSVGYFYRFYVYDDHATPGTYAQTTRTNIMTVTPAMYGIEQTGHFDGTFTVQAGATSAYIWLGSANALNGIGDYIEVRNLILVEGSTAAAYTPAPEDVGGYTGTVYGGTLDVTRGTLMARPYYASYSGQTLVGPWVSSMDVYAAGTTPTTGAQVVDLGGTLTTVSVTPATVQTRTGNCYVWADTGDASMTYYTTGTPTWSDISGETANALSVTASLEAAQRQYRCALTEGSAEAVSDAAGIVIQ